MGFGPCLCGDTCCPSCGPAQGNWRCELCGEWASDDAVHIDEATGTYKPEYAAEAQRRHAAARLAEDRYYHHTAQQIRVACPLGPNCAICREDKEAQHGEGETADDRDD